VGKARSTPRPIAGSVRAGYADLDAGDAQTIRHCLRPSPLRLSVCTHCRALDAGAVGCRGIDNRLYPVGCMTESRPGHCGEIYWEICTDLLAYPVDYVERVRRAFLGSICASPKGLLRPLR